MKVRIASGLTRLGCISSHPTMPPAFHQGNYKLKCTAECRDGIAEAKEDAPVTIDRTGKLLRFLDARGRLLGTLSARHAVAKQLEAGETLLHCSVAWTYGVSDGHPHGLVSARVVIGDPNDAGVQWHLREVWGKPREVRAPTAYAVNIVGESFFQEAIQLCRSGEAITLYREIGNPYDDHAIVAKTVDNRTIGYIARAHWLQRVIHEEGCGAEVVIQALYPVGSNLAVVLAATVTGNETAEAAYQPPSAPAKGWIARLIDR